MNWFEEVFGFKEYNYGLTKKQFILENNNETLICLKNNKKFEIGKFECLSLNELKRRLKNKSINSDLKNMTFENIKISINEMHMNKENKESVIQVASLFNCL
jgi:hypothetical protein